MTKSNYFFLSGEAATVGSHGNHSYVFHSGEPVLDRGESDYVFETGTGLGGGIQVTISDDAGEVTESFPAVESSQSISEFWDYGGGGGALGSSAAGDILNWVADDYVTILVYRDTSTGNLSAVGHYDKPETGTPGGDIHASFSGIPGDYSLAVEDDPGEFTSYSPPTAAAEQNYTGGATDGWAIGDSTTAGTFTVDFPTVQDNTQGVSPPSKIRYIGGGGSTVERPLSTATSVEISMG